MSGHRRSRLGDSGAQAVELALVLPVLTVLVFGIIQFGGAYNAYISVTQAAREGARMAAVGTFNTADVKARANALDPSLVTISSPTLVNDSYGNYYQVTVTYPYTLTIPFWGTQNLNLTSTARMRAEE